MQFNSLFGQNQQQKQPQRYHFFFVSIFFSNIISAPEVAPGARSPLPSPSYVTEVG